MFLVERRRQDKKRYEMSELMVAVDDLRFLQPKLDDMAPTRFFESKDRQAERGGRAAFCEKKLGIAYQAFDVCDDLADGLFARRYILRLVGHKSLRRRLIPCWGTRRKSLHRVAPCTKTAGVTIGIPWKGLRAKRSPSPETIRSARPLTASSRNLSSVGSRHATMRSVIVTASAAAISFFSQACVSGSISEAKRGRATTSNSCCSVASDLSRPPWCSIRSAAIPGIDCCFSAALTRTLVSRTTLIQHAVRLPLRLLDQPVDIVIVQTGRDDTRPRCAPAGDQLVGLDRDRDAIIRVEAALRELGGDLADRRFDHFALRSHGVRSFPRNLGLRARAVKLAPMWLLPPPCFSIQSRGRNSTSSEALPRAPHLRQRSCRSSVAAEIADPGNVQAKSPPVIVAAPQPLGRLGQRCWENVLAPSLVRNSGSSTCWWPMLFQ